MAEVEAAEVIVSPEEIMAMLKEREEEVIVEPEPPKPKKPAKPKKVKPKPPVKVAPSTPIEQATVTEEKSLKKLEGLMGGYIEELLPEYKEAARKKGLKGFCMPPSLKESIIKKLKTKISSKINAIQRKQEEGKPVTREESGLVTSMYGLAEAMTRMPACEIGEIEHMFKVVQEEYPEKVDKTFDEFINEIAREKTVATMKRHPKLREALSEQIGEEAEEILEEMGVEPAKAKPEQKRVAKTIAEKKVLAEAPTKSEDQFISRWHKDIYMQLHGYLYDGAKGQKGYIPSPCGLEIPMTDKEAIGKSEDILAFFGSKDDWADFYVTGEEGVEAGMTFHKMHENDWPGCILDIFKGNKFITKDELWAKIKELNEKKKLGIKKKELVDAEELPEGYGY